MSVSPLLDAAGRRRSPATLPGFHAGRPPRNKGVRFPADPPPAEEIIAVMRAAGGGVHGARMCGLVVVLWRAGLRIKEALSLTEVDLDEARGRCLCATARAANVARSAWTVGGGSSRARGSSRAPSCRWARCSASSRDRHAAGGGQATRRARSYGGSRPKQGFGAASRRTRPRRSPRRTARADLGGQDHSRSPRAEPPPRRRPRNREDPGPRRTRPARGSPPVLPPPRRPEPLAPRSRKL